MGLLQKDLPVSLCPGLDNPEGEKCQGRLQGVSQTNILVMSDNAMELRPGDGLTVEFYIEKSVYRFESTVERLLEDGLLALHKPKVIHKSRLREGTRVPLDMEIHFTLWSDTGRFQANLLDISETGIRMVGRKSLRKDSLISLDFYIKEARARIICQGIVAWNEATQDNEYLYESGIQFTTLSNENRKKLGRHLDRLRAAMSTDA